MAKKYKLKKSRKEPEPSFKISYEEELNETLYKAVAITDGQVLVIAGACTGKTITCTSFVDTNGNEYDDWIPAIRLG